MNRRGAGVVLALLLLVASCGKGSDASTSPSAVTVRFGVVSSGGGAEVPDTLISTGLAAQYGFAVQVVPYASPGQQYTLLRGNAADVVPGNILDLERQRRAGLNVRAFLGFQRFSSPIVIPKESTLTDFAQLRHARVGQFGQTTLDWLVTRAAGVKAYGFDLGGAKITQAAPGLLSSLMTRGKLDASLEFASLAVGPVQAGTQRVLTTVPSLMQRAGLATTSLDVVWDVSDAWTTQHPEAVDRLRAAITQAYDRLKTGDRTLWTPLVGLVGITQTSAADAYIKEEISNIDPPFTADLLPDTQHLIDAIITVTGAEPVGFTTLKAGDFLFAPT